MEWVNNLIVWFQAHYVDLIQIVTSTIGVASIIVKLTPTVKDNEILEKIIKFIGKYIALNRTVNDDAIRAAEKK